jgi:hypothetical protein
MADRLSMTVPTKKYTETGVKPVARTKVYCMKLSHGRRIAMAASWAVACRKARRKKRVRIDPVVKVRLINSDGRKRRRHRGGGEGSGGDGGGSEEAAKAVVEMEEAAKVAEKAVEEKAPEAGEEAGKEKGAAARKEASWSCNC